MAVPTELTQDRIGQEINGVETEGGTLEYNLTGSTILDCKFLNCRFERVLMAKTKWINCEFAGSTIISHFNDAEFENCNFSGATFRGLTGRYGGLRVKFKDCNFSEATFNHVFLRASRFNNCNLEGARFLKCDLRGTKANDLPLEVAG
jgi:fluoroquinolone resistance protein